MLVASSQNVVAIAKVIRPPAEVILKRSSQVYLMHKASLAMQLYIKMNERTHDITYIEVLITSYVNTMLPSVPPEHICL